MRKIIIGLAVFVVVAIAALLIIPSLVPSDVYKKQIETQLSKELGRDVAINGDVSLKTFPLIKAKTSGVEIQNPEGFSDTPFLSVETLEARVKLFPLLSKRVEISGFELIRPEISLEKKQDGTANWVMASQAGDPVETTSEPEGPFQRDGRFTSVDPQIAAFTLSDGRIRYRDDNTNYSAELSDIDGFLSLPSLSKPMKMDMTFDYEGKRIEIDSLFNSPRAFLDGNEAPLKVMVKTDFANVEIDGRFLKSQALDFKGNVKSDISDFKAIQSLSPETLPYIELLSKLTANGDVTFQNDVLNVSGSDIQIMGDGLSASYKGDATLSDTPVLSGAAKLDVTKFSGLKPYLPEDLPSLDFMQSITASTTLNGTPNGFKADNIISAIKGEGLSGSFNGVANYSAAPNQAAMVTVNGGFVADIADTANAAKIAQLNTPYATLLGALSAKGDISYNGNLLTLSELETAATNGAINGRYTGGVTLAESPIANGDFSLDIPDLSVVAKVLPEQNPYAQSVKKITATGRVETIGDIFSLPVLNANLEDGLIIGKFEGSGQYSVNASDALSLNGELDTTIRDLRQLAALSGTELPPNTAAGTIFNAVSLSGDVDGTTEKFTLADAVIEFDDIKGTGNVTLTMGGAKPFVNAALALDGLDLRPYMASYTAQKPTGGIQPWTETPINVEPLKAVNADFTFTTPNVVMDRLKLEETNITATLREGLFKANLPRLSLYGGNGSLDMSFDASQAKPAFNMTVGLDDVEGNGFLSAIAGFTNATGLADTNLTLSSSGLSQAEIMKSLNGKGLFALGEGELKGIDASEFLTGLDDAFKTRALPSGIGSTKSTSFKDIKALFNIENGVVTINDFDFSAIGVAAAGGGTIDLGQQNIDFRFRPRLTGEKASNVANFGIPLQFKGGFGSTKASLDTDFLTTIVAERAKAEAVNRLQEQVKGPVGDILGGIIGGNSSSTTAPTTGGETNPTPKTTEQEIGNVLGGLLGTKKKEGTSAEPATDDTKAEEKKEEKSDLEKALGGLFGE